MKNAERFSDVANSTQTDAIVELEQRLIGWQLKGAPGVLEMVSAEMRGDASLFQVPYNRVQEAIFRAYDAQRAITLTGIIADLHDYAALAQVGGLDLLQALAFASPAVVSAEAGQKQAMETMRAWRALQSPLPKAGDVELIRADTIRPTKIDWVWPGWLAAGKFHLIAGSPGTGKTTLSLSLAASITTGGMFPCGQRSSLGSVLMWTGEDDLADSIIPRFLACGGDRTRLHFVSGVRGENGQTLPFDPAYDVEQLIVAARRIKDLRLLIVDPVVSAVSGDSHKNGETRRCLQPLVDFAANNGVAVLGVTHYSKGTAGRDPAERVTGSLAFVAVSRLVMVTGKPKGQGDSSRLVRAKSNIGPDGGGFEYELLRVSVDEAADIQGQYVLWGDLLEGTAQALLAEIETVESDSDAPQRGAAKQWLIELLGNGMVRSSHVETRALEAGHKWATVRRAKKELGVISVNVGKAGWLWSMPQVLTQSEGAQHENSEHVSTCSPPEHVSTCSDAHPNIVNALPEPVSTLPAKWAGQ